MPATELTIITAAPDPAMSREEAYNDVWGTVTNLLRTQCKIPFSKLYPATLPWEQDMRAPFSVVLGRDDPEKFLTLCLAGQVIQNGAVEHHAKALIESNVGDLQKLDENTLVCRVSADHSDPESWFHALWHMALSDGTLLPDAGLYYLPFGKAAVDEKERFHILSHMADYAACVVTMEFEVDDHA